LDRQPSDDVLMGRIATGDAPAFRLLLDRHLAAVTAFCYRQLGDRSEAEDAAQDTFLKVWQAAAGWKPEAKPTTWIYRIAVNQCIDRHRKRRPQADLDAAADVASADPNPEQAATRADLDRKVRTAMEALPERQRLALVLCHYQGLSQAEAAEILGTGVGAVESLLGRARRELKKLLAADIAQMKEKVA